MTNAANVSITLLLNASSMLLCGVMGVIAGRSMERYTFALHRGQALRARLQELRERQ